MKRVILLLLVAAAWSSVAVAATKEDARVAIAQAQAAVQAAESADAATAANSDLRAAKDNLAVALGAQDRHKWDASVLSAQKASADAHLASARARQVRATSATREIEASIATLRDQLGQSGN